MKVVINWRNEDGELISRQTMSIIAANELISKLNPENVVPNFDGGWDIYEN